MTTRARRSGRGPEATDKGSDMRDRIKAAAVELLIRHGYQGLRFGDIAEALGITRANIHYHFGTKNRLVDEVLAEYLATAVESIGGIWDSDLSYEEKVLATMDFNRQRYLRFNESLEVGGKPWSLISRMRLDLDLLSEAARAGLRAFSDGVERSIAKAIARAQARGEIAEDAPTHDISVQIVSIIDSAGPITLDAGSFVRLEHLYLAHMRVVMHAYVSRARRGGRRRAILAAAS